MFLFKLISFSEKANLDLLYIPICFYLNKHCLRHRRSGCTAFTFQYVSI